MLDDKRGSLLDLPMFIIFSVILLLVSGLMIYMGATLNTKLHETLDGKSPTGVDYNKTITDTFGNVNVAYQSLYWISIVLIVGMMLSIFMGSYMVTTRPIYFIPYIFIVIISIVISVGISNAYMTVINEPTLKATFDGFLGANYIMYYLPIWVCMVGFIGGIIMFVRMKSEEFVPTGF